MTDYAKLAREQLKAHVATEHGITVHDAYDCDREDCRLCADFWMDEKVDRATDERKEAV